MKMKKSMKIGASYIWKIFAPMVYPEKAVVPLTQNAATNIANMVKINI